MSPKFDFNITDSWKAVGKILYEEVGERGEVHKNFISKWEKSKQPLMKLLGPTGRVESRVSRTPSSDEIFEAVHDAIGDTLDKKYHDMLYDDFCEHRKTLGCAFQAVLNTVPIGDVATNRISIAVPDPRPEKAALSKKLPIGTKVTRYTDLVAESLGIPLELRNILLDAFSVAISSVKPQEYTVVLSVNPLDMLLVSECTTGWRSCHSLDGDYCTGPLAYMLDDVTAVAYAYTRYIKKTVFDFSLPKKMWRQMVYFDMKRQSALLSREYPQKNADLTKEVRRLAANLLCAEHNKPCNWKFKNLTDSTALLGEQESYDSTRDCYELYNSSNWQYQDAAIAWIRLPGGQPPSIRIGVEELICPACGCKRDEDDEHDTIFCCRGSARVHCAGCDERIHEDDVHYGPDDEPYCESCFSDSFIYCYYCDNVICIDDAYTGPDDRSYCEHCFNDMFTSCANCGEPVDNDDVYLGSDDQPYCEMCFDDIFTTCESCGEVINNEDAHMGVDGEPYCEDCFNDNFTYCTSCNKLLCNEDALIGEDNEPYCEDCFEEVETCATTSE